MSTPRKIINDNLLVDGDVSMNSNLDVSGNINFTGTLYQDGVEFTSGGASQWTQSGNNIYYDSENVGIGTTDPQTKLDVNGTITGSEIHDTTGNLRTTINSNINNITDVSGRVSTNEVAITNIQTDITDVSGRVSTNETAITDIQTDITDVSGRVSTNETAITDIQTDITDVSGRVSTNETAITNIQTDITDISGRLDSVGETNITDVSGRVSTNETAITSIQADITDISGRLDSVGETNITDVSGRVSTNETAITSIQTDITDVSGRVSTNETAITIIQTDITDISGRLDSVGETNITDVSGRVSTNETAITDIQTDITDVSGRVSTNETAITDIQTNITDVSGRVSTNETAITSIQTDITDISGRLDSVGETNITDVSGRVSTNETAITDIQTYITDVSGRVSTNETTITSIQTDISGRVSTNETAIASNSSNISTNTSNITSLDNGKVSKSGDTITGNLRIYNNASLTADFNIDNSVRFYSDTFVDGNLGIGTTDPSYELHVIGNTKITGNIISSGTLQLSSSIEEDYDLYVANDSFSRIRVERTDNSKGWELNTDSKQLNILCDEGMVINVNNDTSVFRLVELTKDNEINFNSNIDVSGDINFTGTLYQDGVEFTSGGGGSSLWSSSSSNIYYTSGNVGIGINNPTKTLDISGDINFTGTLYQDGNVFSSSISNEVEVGLSNITESQVVEMGNLSTTLLLGQGMKDESTGYIYYMGTANTSVKFSYSSNNGASWSNEGTGWGTNTTHGAFGQFSDGRMIMTGGILSSSYVSTCKLWWPIGNENYTSRSAWTSTNSLTQARGRHSVIVLKNYTSGVDRCIVISGETNGSYLKTIEYADYTISTGTLSSWTSYTPSLTLLDETVRQLPETRTPYIGIFSNDEIYLYGGLTKDPGSIDRSTEHKRVLKSTDGGMSWTEIGQLPENVTQSGLSSNFAYVNEDTNIKVLFFLHGYNHISSSSTYNTYYSLNGIDWVLLSTNRPISSQNSFGSLLDSDGSIVYISGNGTNKTVRYMLNYHLMASHIWSFTDSNNIYYNNGNVGIGTNNASAKIHLSSDSDCGLIIDSDYDNTSVGELPFIKLRENGGVDTVLEISGKNTGDSDVDIKSNEINLWTGNTLQQSMQIDRDGVIYFNRYSTTGSLSINGDNSITSSSDMRLKTDIEYLTDTSMALSEIKEWKPSTFKWKDVSDGRIVVGFIAQDFESLELSKKIVDGKKYDYEFEYEYDYRDVEKQKQRVDDSGNLMFEFEINENGERIETTKPLLYSYIGQEKILSSKRIKLDASGNPVLDYSKPRYRGLDNRGLISIQTLAIQELEKVQTSQKATIQEQQERISTLETQLLELTARISNLESQ
jgi:predicted  nucleic acid-binding Zn-ribbon protein